MFLQTEGRRALAESSQPNIAGAVAPSAQSMQERNLAADFSKLGFPTSSVDLAEVINNEGAVNSEDFSAKSPFGRKIDLKA